MANERTPDDPYRSQNDPYRSQNDPYRPSLAGDNLRDPTSLDPARLDPTLLDAELQPDPKLAEGPASGGRIAMFAMAIALVLGAIFYGLNGSSINQAGTTPTARNATPPTAQTTAQTTAPAPPAGMRDVTPRANTQPGVTTGAAPARPQTPPSSAPTGQDMNRSGNPPADNIPPNK